MLHAMTHKTWNDVRYFSKRWIASNVISNNSWVKTASYLGESHTNIRQSNAPVTRSTQLASSWLRPSFEWVDAWNYSITSRRGMNREHVVSGGGAVGWRGSAWVQHPDVIVLTVGVSVRHSVVSGQWSVYRVHSTTLPLGQTWSVGLPRDHERPITRPSWLALHARAFIRSFIHLFVRSLTRQALVQINSPSLSLYSPFYCPSTDRQTTVSSTVTYYSPSPITLLLLLLLVVLLLQAMLGFQTSTSQRDGFSIHMNADYKQQ